MRALRPLGLTLVVGLPFAGMLAWRVMSAIAAPAAGHSHVMRHERHLREPRTRLFNLCTQGFESISPCTASATVYVHGGGTKVFQLQNNSSFDDILDVFCTKPGVLSACSVTPGIDTVKAGRSKNVTLSFTAGAAGGTGVILIDASGNVDLEASDTITVNPVQVTPRDTTIARTPDTTYTQSFTVKNLGNVADTVTLAKTCSAGFTCTLLTASPMALAARVRARRT